MLLLLTHRRMVREQLKALLLQLAKEKPSETADDPRDISIIESAKSNVGDYKLKSHPNYIVPEDMHVNASQKKKQITLLHESVHYIKMGLNERALALKNLKQRIILNVSNDLKRINQINVLLSDEDGLASRSFSFRDDHLWNFKESESDNIDNRWKFSKEQLIEFESLLKKEASKRQKKDQNAFGGENDGDSTEESAKQLDAKAATKVNKSENEKEFDQTNSHLESTGINKIELAISQDDTISSDVQKFENDMQRNKLEYEKNILLKKIDAAIHTFDDALAELRDEKYKLLADLKKTDLKFKLMTKELNILSSFEEKERELNVRLLKCRTEKAQVVVDLTECQERLSSKLDEIQTWQEKDKRIMKEFDHIVGERNPFYEQLKRIFKRKIKRNANRSNVLNKRGEPPDADRRADANDSIDLNDDNSDDSSNDSDDESNELTTQDGTTGKSADDSCPKDCDNLIYEKVMELREKRLDQEEILAEFQKSVDELKHQNNLLQTKERSIDKKASATH